MATATLATVGSFLLAVVFLTSALWKIRNTAAFERSLDTYLDVSSPLLVWLVVLIEFSIGLALFVGVVTQYAAGLASLLLLAFAAGTTRLVLLGREVACGCGGILGSTRAAAGLIVRNVALASAAAFVAWHSPASMMASLRALISEPTSLQALSWGILASLSGALVLGYGVHAGAGYEAE